MIDQNRRTPPAPSTAAASCRSRGIDWRPAVTMMNVKPRWAQTLDNPTAKRAVPGSCNQPGSFTDGKMLLNHSMLARAPTDGCRRNNHIRLATATEVATVEENTVRNEPILGRYLSASTANPMPAPTPSGTVIRAKRNVTPRAFWNSMLRNRSTYWSRPFDTQLLPKLSHRCWPSTIARPSG